MPLGLPRDTAVVEPYDHEWPALFEEERRRIMAAVGHIVAGVHHVGSTSIPGMPAKPILDIAVLLHEFKDGKRCIEPLEKIGYVHKGLEDDIPGDRFFLRGHPPQESCSVVQEIRTHILHMYTLDSPIVQSHFAFRNYLIAHPEAADEYAQIKLALADKHPDDRASYSVGKRSFITGVLAKAAQESE